MKDDSVSLVPKGEFTACSNDYSELDSPENILAFGKEATLGISKFSDQILSQFSLSYTDESSKLLSNLNQLMNRFDKQDFQATKQSGILSQLFSVLKKKADNIYDKYTVFSKEIDKIFIEIKKFEFEITDNNSMLDQMYDENMRFYSQLEQYIVICKQYLQEKIVPDKNALEQRIQQNEDGLARIQLGKCNEIIDILEQRIYDLELAKAVSLQTAPQVKMIQKGNYNLVRKINSAFVITMPLFKQGIIQAITIKRQKLHMDSMNALDESTNRLLKQNAQNIVENTKSIVQSNQNSAVRIETIIESYNTIINGMKEIEEIQQENKKQREESLLKMEELKYSLMTGKTIPVDVQPGA